VLYPRSVAVLLELIEDYKAVGDDKVADEIRDRVLRDFPGLGTGILRERRDRALAAEDWGEARRIQERISALESDSSVNEADRAVRLGLTYQRAVEDLENDRYEEADKAIFSVLEEEPRFVPALLLRGEGAVLRGRPGEAVDLWKEGFHVTGSPVLLQRIEDHFIEREQPIEAIDTLHKIINASESSLLPRFFLGRLFYRLEMPEEALRTLEDLAEEISRSPAYHLLLARIRHRRGDLGAAAESYLKCVQEAGLSGVGYVCRACRRRYDDWRDRCAECGSWNSVELNFELEKFSPEDLGLRQAPVWSHYGPAD
jgi:tetratricopeptide (TPR) repeat protein